MVSKKTIDATRANARGSLSRTKAKTAALPVIDDAPRIEPRRLASMLKAGALGLRRMAESGSVNEAAYFAARDRLGMMTLDALRLGAIPEARIVLDWWDCVPGAEEAIFPGTVAAATYKIPHGVNVLDGIARLLFPEGVATWTNLVGDDQGAAVLDLLRGADAVDAVADSLDARHAMPANALPLSTVPIDETDRLILCELRKFGIASCVKVLDLANAIGRERSNIGPRLASLRAAGLVDIPKGERKGYALTAAGLARIGNAAH